MRSDDPARPACAMVAAGSDNGLGGNPPSRSNVAGAPVSLYTPGSAHATTGRRQRSQAYCMTCWNRSRTVCRAALTWMRCRDPSRAATCTVLTGSPATSDNGAARAALHAGPPHQYVLLSPWATACSNNDANLKVEAADGCADRSENPWPWNAWNAGT